MQKVIVFILAYLLTIALVYVGAAFFYSVAMWDHDYVSIANWHWLIRTLFALGCGMFLIFCVRSES